MGECADANTDCLGWMTADCLNAINDCMSEGIEVCTPEIAQYCILGATSPEYSSGNETAFWDCPGDIAGCVSGTLSDCTDALSDCSSILNASCLEALASCAVELELCIPAVASSCL